MSAVPRCCSGSRSPPSSKPSARARGSRRRTEPAHRRPRDHDASMNGKQASAQRSGRPTLLTPMFLTVAFAELAYFTADGVLLPALVAVGLSLRLPPMRPEGAAPERHRLVHPGGLLPGVVLLAAIWGMSGFLAFVPLYAVHDLDMAGSRLVLGLFARVVVAIRSVGATIPDRICAGRSTRIALVLTALGLLIVGL